MIDRAEAAGLGVATVGHLTLLVAIAYAMATVRLPLPKSDPIEVSFVEEAGLESTAPLPAAEAPAPLLAPEVGPPVPAMPAPPEVSDVPRPAEPLRRAPAPTPAPVAKPPVRPASPRAATPPAKARPAPPKAAPAPSNAARKPAVTRSTGRLAGLLNGVSDNASESRSTAPPAASAGPAVQASLGAEVRRQVKPHWRAPTGADAEQLRTEVAISLAENGSVVDVRIVGTSGQTASNRPQVRLHQEKAERAVRLASPFRLPAQYYSAWKSLRITFDKRLSQ